MQPLSPERKAEGRHAGACGYEPPYSEDVTFPVPREIFPTGKKTARYGLVVPALT
ncbi:hypothetical protein ACVOMT_22425 [Sphingomonas panni]